MSNLNRLYQQKIPGVINQLQGSNQGSINRHMSSLMGAQKSLLDNYVKRAAGAGIRRGGMNIVGGSPLASSLALQATKGLASQYGANYGQAVNYANADRASSQQLLSQLMSGVNSSGGYNTSQPNGPKGVYVNRTASQGNVQAPSQPRTSQAYDRKRLRQDREWELTQRGWKKAEYNRQRLQDQRENNRQIRVRAQQQDAYKQQLEDEEYARRQNRKEQKRADEAYRQSQIAQRQAQQAMTARPGALTHGRITGRTAQAANQPAGQEQSTGNKTLDEFQQKYQKQKMMNELAQMAQQTKQSKLQTQQQELQLSGEEYKQNAWRRAQNPYIQSMNAFLGLGGIGYGGMNNARLGQARIAADVWGGLTKPSNRSFSWSNSTSVSGSRNAYKR